MVQLKRVRPDLQYVPLRGNVDTRLRRCEEGTVDAIVLAFAGLRRLGLEARVTEVLEPEILLPAVGQGALAIECRAADQQTLELIAPLQHVDTAISVSAERGVMHAVEGNCQVPVAAYALREGASMWLRGLLADSDGGRLRQHEVHAAWPTHERAAFELGCELGEALRDP